MNPKLWTPYKYSVDLRVEMDEVDGDRIGAQFVMSTAPFTKHIWLAYYAHTWWFYHTRHIENILLASPW